MKKSTLSALAIAITGLSTNAFAQDSQPTTDAQVSTASQQASKTFNQNEIATAATHFFGETSTGIGRAVERVFREKGEPVGYIEGTEISAALGVGLRYGKGTLVMKDGERRPVKWQGPSIGFDTGANGSKVFTLVYNLGNPDAIYRRYPGVEGAAFFIAGVSVTYQQAEGVILAPMRTGVGFRLGANAGYTAYSRERRLLPF